MDTIEQLLSIDAGTTDELRAAEAIYPELRDSIEAIAGSRYYTWEPRPDNHAEQDQQTAFVESDVKFAVCLGGTGCLAGEQEVWDVETGTHRQVGDIQNPFVVHSAGGNSLANAPFRKGVDSIYRVALSNGQEFRSTENHRVLTDRGWMTVRDAWHGDVPLLSSAERPSLCPHESAFGLRQSSSGDCPSVSRPSARRLFGTVPSFLDDCPERFRFCGEQPRSAKECARSYMKQPNGVHEHNRNGSRLGEMASRSRYTLPCRSFGHLSMQGFSGQGTNPQGASGIHACCTLSRPVLPTDQGDSRSVLRIIRRLHTISSFLRLANRFGCEAPWDISNERDYVAIVSCDRDWETGLPVTIGGCGVMSSSISPFIGRIAMN